MTIQDIKFSVEKICDRHNVKKLVLFGSYARGEESSDSDMDFCVSFSSLSPKEYAKHFFGVFHELQETLGHKVDLLSEHGLTKQSLKERIDRDGVRLYG